MTGNLARLHVGILAHDQRFVLPHMVGNIHTFVPDVPEAKVVLYNGGRDSALHHGLDVEVCPYSKPLPYGKLEMLALDVMKWLYEERRKYDFLVTLDSDMLFIKPGFPDYLKVVMANSAYMGVRFQEVLPRTTWSTGKGFRSKWKRVWQPVFQTTNPFAAYNPGQVFRKEYVDKLMNREVQPDHCSRGEMECTRFGGNDLSDHGSCTSL